MYNDRFGAHLVGKMIVGAWWLLSVTKMYVWWFHFFSAPTKGNGTNLSYIYFSDCQMGWNHQLDIHISNWINSFFNFLYNLNQKSHAPQTSLFQTNYPPWKQQPQTLLFQWMVGRWISRAKGSPVTVVAGSGLTCELAGWFQIFFYFQPYLGEMIQFD